MTIDLSHVLALNAAHEVETSPLNQDRLTHMVAHAFRYATAGEGRDGFLIAFDQAADYDSVNFRWFQARYDRFVYIDRVVVAPHARGRGLARRFYADLFGKARAADHVRIVAEINLDPPNPGSLAFHGALGFHEIGQAMIGDGSKTVSYQECLL